MPPKKYTTADQRHILSMAGIEHTSGRSFEDAESLIDENIQRGTLPSDIRDRATIRQRKELDRFGVEYSQDISKENASRIIDEHTEPTGKQLEFLQALDVEIPLGLTKKSASDLIEEYTQIRPMSDGQAQFIDELGGIVIRSMTYKDAGGFIEYLLDNELTCVRCGERLDRRSERCDCGAFAPKTAPIRPPRHLLPRSEISKAEQPASTLVVRHNLIFG